MLPNIVLVVALAGAVPAVDAYGDPLPPGAVARFGTVRWRGMGHTGVISPDGKTLVVDWMQGLEAWDLATGVLKYRAEFPFLTRETSNGKRAAVFTPDGSRILAAGGHDLRVFDARTGDLIRRIDCAPVLGGRAGAYGVGFGGDIAYIYGDRWVLPVDWQRAGLGIVWEPEDCTGLIVSEYGGMVAVKSKLGGLDLYDAATRVRRDGRLPMTGRGAFAAFSRDGTLIAESDVAMVSVYATATGEKQMTVHVAASIQWIGRVAFSRDNTVLFTGGADGRRIHRWDARTGAGVAPDLPKPVSHSPGQLLPAADGRKLYSVSAFARLRTWDLAKARLRSVDAFDADFQVAVSPSGRRIAAADRYGQFQIAELPAVAAPVRGAADQSWTRLAWLADDSLLTADPTGDVRRWRADGTGGDKLCNVPKRSDKDPQTYFTDLVAAPDGTAFVAGAVGGFRSYTADGTLRWFRPASAGPNVVHYHPDGRTVFVRPYYKRPSGLAADTGLDAFTLATDPTDNWFEYPRIIAISPDGRWLAVTESKGLQFRRPQSGKREGAWSLPEQSHAGNEVTAAAVITDSLYAAAGTNDGRTFLVDPRTAQVLLAFGRHDGRVAAIHALPGGRHLVTRADDGTALVWNLRPPYADRDASDVWAGLTSPDGPRAYGAIWHMADHFDRYAAAVEKRFPPTNDPDPEPAAKKYITALDGPKFADRAAALKALQKLAADYPGLRDLLEAERAKSSSAEVRAKLGDLLKTEAAPWSADLVRSRVLAAAERSEKPEAKALLKAWAAGTPAARLTIEAKAVLRRAGEK